MSVEETRRKTGKSKWQDASAKLTQIRVDLDKILGDGFSEEEKQSERYRQLFESVQLMFKHVEEYYGTEKPRFGWKPVIITALSAMAAALAEKFGGFIT